MFVHGINEFGHVKNTISESHWYLGDEVLCSFLKKLSDKSFLAFLRKDVKNCASIPLYRWIHLLFDLHIYIYNSNLCYISLDISHLHARMKFGALKILAMHF